MGFPQPEVNSPSGAAGGELAGTYPNPTVVRGIFDLIGAADAAQAAAQTYTDTSLAARNVKQACFWATAAALPANVATTTTLTGVAFGALTVDGNAVAVGDRVLVKDQAAAAQNGIYVVTATGAAGAVYVLTRSDDMNAAGEFPGAYTEILAGTANVGTSWEVVSPGPFVVGTTAVNWTEFQGGVLPKSGGTMTGALVLAGDPTTALNPVTKQYGDTRPAPTNIISKNANYAAAAGDLVLADTSGGGWTLTLPGAPTTGQVVGVKKISADTNTLTITPNVDGVALTVMTPGRSFIVEWDGAAWRAIYGNGAAPADIQVFTSSGTWTKPTNPVFKTASIIAIGGGGGGGAGRRGAAGTVRCGGGGGGGAAMTAVEYPLSLLGATETVTIGGGAIGGTAQTVDSTDGQPGGTGGHSVFGSWILAARGSSGGGGTAANGTSGSGGTGFVNGAAGASASTTGLTGALGGIGGSSAGGGSGAGITSGDAVSAGGNGGNTNGATTAGGARAGGLGGAAGAAGNVPAVQSAATEPMGGPGGGGGGSSITAAAGAGGAGGQWGGGGGGGGASLNGNNSGAGGAGAPGIVVVISQ